MENYIIKLEKVLEEIDSDIVDQESLTTPGSKDLSLIVLNTISDAKISALKIAKDCIFKQFPEIIENYKAKYKG